MEQKLRYACIGAGGIARKKHLNQYSKLPDVEIVAVCDTNLAAAQALARDFGVEKVYDDYRALLRQEKPDIVSVCTPNATHKDIAAEALRQGCNVHVEKPMALSAAEAQEIVDLERKYGKKVQIGLNKRFLGTTLLLKRLLSEGFFGDVYHVRCGWERSSGIPGVGRWFTDSNLSGGGALIDLGVHYLDLAMYMMGWPEPKQAIASLNNSFLREGGRIRRGYKSSDGPVNVEDMANGTIMMQTGETLDFCFSWASNIEKEVTYVEVYGSKAGFRLENNQLRLYTQAGGTMFTMIPDEATIPLDESEARSFVDSILRDTAPEATAEQGLKVMKLIDLIYSSAVHYGK